MIATYEYVQLFEYMQLCIDLVGNSRGWIVQKMTKESRLVMLQTNNNSKPVQGQERDPPLQPRSSALRGCSACPGIQPQFNLLDQPQQCGIDPKNVAMWQGKHLRHQGVEGLAVGNGPHPICKEWHWVKDFQGKQLMSIVLLLKKNSMKRQGKIVPEDITVLIAIPTPGPDRAKRGSSTSSMYLWWQSLCFCTGTDAWKSYQPKLLQKWHTARVRNGTIKKDVRHIFRSSLFFAFLGQTWAQNLCPWHWRLWNIAGFLQSQIRI